MEVIVGILKESVYNILYIYALTELKSGMRCLGKIVRPQRIPGAILGNRGFA
jgi:hypothetical protein